MDPDIHHELRPRGVDGYRGEANALLRAVRAGTAVDRAADRSGVGARRTLEPGGVLQQGCDGRLAARRGRRRRGGANLGHHTAADRRLPRRPRGHRRPRLAHRLAPGHVLDRRRRRRRPTVGGLVRFVRAPAPRGHARAPEPDGRRLVAAAAACERSGRRPRRGALARRPPRPHPRLRSTARPRGRSGPGPALRHHPSALRGVAGAARDGLAPSSPWRPARRPRRIAPRHRSTGRSTTASPTRPSSGSSARAGSRNRRYGWGQESS
jgi:hypothetical protein